MMYPPKTVGLPINDGKTCGFPVDSEVIWLSKTGVFPIHNGPLYGYELLEDPTLHK